MSAEERADLEAMHANEKRLYDQLDNLDEELLKSRERAAQVEADKQNLLDEFETLQTQVLVVGIKHVALQAGMFIVHLRESMLCNCSFKFWGRTGVVPSKFDI